ATEHVNFVGVITNSLSGNTYPDPGHFQRVIDLTTGEETVVGLVFLTPVPGLGPVLHDTGKVVFDENGDVRPRRTITLGFTGAGKADRGESCSSIPRGIRADGSAPRPA